MLINYNALCNRDSDIFHEGLRENRSNQSVESRSHRLQRSLCTKAKTCHGLFNVVRRDYRRRCSARIRVFRFAKEEKPPSSFFSFPFPSRAIVISFFSFYVWPFYFNRLVLEREQTRAYPTKPAICPFYYSRGS